MIHPAAYIVDTNLTADDMEKLAFDNRLLLFPYELNS